MTDLYYGCRVTIGGAQLAGAWDGSDTLVGIASVTVTAGRDTIYGDEDAASATIKLIDPAGVWSFSTRISGAIITVDLDSDRWPLVQVTRLILGRGNTLSVDRAEVINPRTKQPQTVWVATITVKDAIVDLEALTLAGPNADGSWPAQLGQDRIAYIRGKITTASALVSDLANANVVNVGQLPAATSIADAIRWIYAADRPTTQPVHDPFSGAIEESNGLEAAEVPGIKLVYDGDTVTATPVSDQTYVIPAGQVIVPDGITPSAGVADAIDLIHVTYLDGSGNDQTYTARTARYDPAALGTRAWSIKTALTTQTDAAALAARAVEIANASNDVLKMPALEHRPEFWTDIYIAQEQPYWTQAIAGKWNLADGIYFDGALTNSMPNMPVLHKLINRTAQFTADGWTFTFNVYPAAAGGASTLTLGDLATASPATLGECAGPVTVGLLGNITKGLD